MLIVLLPADVIDDMIARIEANPGSHVIVDLDAI